MKFSTILLVLLLLDLEMEKELLFVEQNDNEH